MAIPSLKIEFVRLEEDLFEARCPDLGLAAPGDTIAEAEAAVLRLIDERREQVGALAPTSMASERDTRLLPAEE